MTNFNNLLFYDIEVFRDDWLVVFKDINKKIIAIFHEGVAINSREEYRKGSDGIREVISGKTLVSYNGHHYDDYILAAIIDERPVRRIKQINDLIISNKRFHIEMPEDILRSIDCFRQIDVSMPSLKYIEGNRGSSIKESSIPFTIERSLTDDELEETIMYCEHDVDELVEVWLLRESSYFEPKEMLINMLPEEQQSGMNRRNTTNISENLLLDKGQKLTKWSTWHLTKKPANGSQIEWDKQDQEIRNNSNVPDEVWDMWNQPIEHRKKKSITVKEFGAKIVFGFGGLHGVNNDKTKKFNNVYMLDVESLYPNIIILLIMLGQLATERFSRILNRRLEAKHAKKIVLSNALKIIINSVYGNLINKFSRFYNPYVGQSVCMFGQIALYDLSERLYDIGCKLVNINTDGVGFTIPDPNDFHFREIAKEWEEDWGLKLTEDFFEKFVQKDVNNYIAVKPDGKIKSKGGEVSRYKKNAYFKNNSLRIVDIAIAEKILYNKSPLDVVLEHIHEPLLFQQILRVGRTYAGTCDRDGNLLNTRVNRVFAANENVQSTTFLYKMRPDGRTERFPNSPDRMLIYNDDLKSFDEFESIIDIQFYVDLINDALERWS